MCDRKGCTIEPEWHPVVLVRVHSQHPPIEMVIGLKICGLCKIRLKLDDVFSEDTWNLLVEKLAAMGKAKPTRELTSLTWTRLNSKLARQLGPRGLN